MLKIIAVIKISSCC